MIKRQPAMTAAEAAKLGLPAPGPDGVVRLTRAQYERIQQDAHEAARTLERVHDLEQARRSPFRALEYFLRDEETGGRIALQPIHREMIRAMLGAPNAVVTASPEMGKTQIGIGLALYLLGHATNDGVSLRVAFCAETFTVAARMASTAAKYIAGDTEGARAYRELFPKVRPSSTEAWSEEKGYFVARETPAKDPSIFAIGLDTGVLSARIDLLILDDVVTLRNTATVYQRKKVVAKYDGELSHRCTKDARRWLLGNAWWEGDLLDVLGRRADWSAITLSICRQDGSSTWPARWPEDRIKTIRANNPEWRRILLAERRRLVEGNPFGESVDRALESGVGLTTINRIEPGTCDGWRVSIGCDLGFLRNGSKDPLATRSAFFVWALLPDGRRRVLRCISGQWSSFEWFATAHRLNRDFEVMSVSPTFLVESNGGQRWIAEQAGGQGLDVRAFYTGANKWDPAQGVTSLANDMQRGDVIIPCDAGPVVACEELDAWIAELRAFSPGAHTGDRAMASWIGAAGLRMAAAGRYAVGSAGDAADAAEAAATVRKATAEAEDRIDPVAGQAAAFWGDMRARFDFGD